MDKMGINYSYWEENWLADYPYYIKKAANLGFDAVELSTVYMIDMPSGQLEKIKNTIQEEKIEATYCIGLSPEYDIASKDIKTRQKGIEYLKKTLELVHNMGGKVFGGVNYGAWNTFMDQGEIDKRPYIERSVESMKKIIKTAEDYNVLYNVEILNRFEQFILNNVKEGINYVNMVGNVNLKLHLDTFHMNIEEDSFTEAIETAGNKLGHLHISENNRKLPGAGNIPWHEIIRALRRIDYKGTMIMEAFLKPSGEIGRDLKIWEDRSPKDFDSEAKSSLEFIRSLMKLNQ